MPGSQARSFACNRSGCRPRGRGTCADGDDYTLITGNEMGVLLLDYICKMRLEREDLSHKVAVTTIVFFCHG